MWGRAKFAALMAAMDFRSKAHVKTTGHPIGERGPAQSIGPWLRRNGKPTLTEDVLLDRGLKFHNSNLSGARAYLKTHKMLAKGVCSDAAN